MTEQKKAKTDENVIANKEVKSEFKVKDPQELRPKELPLVISPSSGGWKNDEQAEYAKYLNGYAYKNPAKWATKKETLLERLSEIGSNPDAIIKYRGAVNKVSFKNQMITN